MAVDYARDRRTIEGTVIMHGTSRHRLEAARLLAKVVQETGASGASYGWAEGLAPGRLAPIHSVGGAPRFRWATTLPPALARGIDRPGGSRWELVIRGLDPERLEALGPLLSLATDRLVAADLYDCPTIPDEATRGPDGRFIALLDALRFVGFTVERPSDMIYIQAGLRGSIPGLPARGHAAADAVADAFSDLDRLTVALLHFARALELEGCLAGGAAVYVMTYELALLRCDADAGVDAAHGAGRTFRKLTNWHEALRWYQLGLRLAVHRNDFLHAARLLDGLGNTHRERGAFPAARRCYLNASRLALVAGDPVEVANVALGLVTVEREAGRLDEAARIAWRAWRAQTDPRQRVNLLLNLATLLRDGGAIELAEDTYGVVQHVADEPEVRLMAMDALAYCAALRGATADYERRRDALRGRARDASPYIRAQIGYFRGASLRALGDARALRVLRATERYARAHGLREWEVRAGGLADEPIYCALAAVAAIRAPEEVRHGIESLGTTAARGSSTEV
jgi:tetratricopeptide (TPR) repeat protein